MAPVDAADRRLSFLPLALLAAPAHRVFSNFVSAAGRKQKPLPQWVLCHEVTPVHTAMRNCTRDEGRPFEFGNQVLISSHRKLLSSKATVVNVAEKSGHDLDRHG